MFCIRVFRVPAMRMLAGLFFALATLIPDAARANTLPTMFAPTGVAAGDFFGWSVASAGDVNGDGHADVIVGAWANDALGANTGVAYVYYGGPGADAVADLTLVGEAAGDVFGISVGCAGDVNGDGYDDVVVGATQNDAGGTNAGRAYVYFGGPAADAVADLTLTGAAAGDQFGMSVGSAGDMDHDGYDDVLVGAPTNDAVGVDAGRAYVFRGGSSPDAVADLTLSGLSAGDRFGTRVAPAGDLNGDGYDDVIVGAPARTGPGGATYAGAAYVFFGGASLNATADLTLSGATAGDQFGGALGAAGDVNGDGYDDVVVGAEYNDAGGSNAGRAYLFYGGASPNAVADLVLTGLAAGDYFGQSVSSAGDVNGDGYDDILVGAPFNDQGGTDAGALYVFLGGPGLDTVADRTLTGRLAGDELGYSAAVAGDVNGDGRADLVGGAPYDDAGGGNAGRAYVLDMGPPPAVAHRLELTFTDTDALGRVGNAVGTAGDVNGDGYADLIVGQYMSDAGGTYAGRAYIHFGGPAADSIPDLVMTGAAAYDYFGYAVGTAGDVNGDGFDDWLVGAMQNDASGQDAGAVYLYYGGASPDANADMVLTGAAANDLFGCSVGTAGDVNHDGYDDFIIGARYNDAGGTNAGRAYVYFGGTPPHKVADWTLTGAAANDNFGISVGTAGDVNRDGYDDVIVGAPTHDAAGTDAGAAYVFYGGTSPDATADLTVWGAAPGDYFGTSVGTAGDVNGDGYADVVVGAPLSDVGGLNIGRAYVFFGGATADAVADLALPGVAAGDEFGHAVGTAGDVNGDGYADVIVGAYYNDTGGSTAGAAYVFFGGAGADTVADVTLLGLSTNDAFGTSVGAAGDVFGDGFPDVIVGAPYSDMSASQSGAAYVFDFNRYLVTSPNGGETWTRTASEVVSWLGAEPADLWLSVDDGISYELLQENVGGLASNAAEVTVPDVVSTLARVKATPREPWTRGSDASDAVFTIQSGAGVEPGNSTLRLRAPWPNPAVGVVRLGLELAGAAVVTVSVLDVAGREVARPIAGEKFEAGRTTREWRPQGLAPGIYVVRAAVGPLKLTRRLVWLGGR